MEQERPEARLQIPPPEKKRKFILVQMAPRPQAPAGSEPPPGTGPSPPEPHAAASPVLGGRETGGNLTVAPMIGEGSMLGTSGRGGADSSCEGGREIPVGDPSNSLGEDSKQLQQPLTQVHSLKRGDELRETGKIRKDR